MKTTFALFPDFMTWLFSFRRENRKKTPSFLRRYPFLIVISIVFLSLVTIISLMADLVAPYHYASQDLLIRLAPPVFWGGTEKYLLGTDFLGRDILSRLLYATRMSITVALLGTFISTIIGTTLGFLAAHYRGWVEEGIMVAVDYQAALPFMLLALSVLAFFGNSLILFICLMGLNGWERYTRLTRGLVLTSQRKGYAMAVHSLGASPLRLYCKHILPNIAGVLIVQFTLNFSQTILLETSLSFLGLGVQPPLTSLGSMLGEGRNYLLSAWWISVMPGCIIFLVTLSSCIVGDWLRDRLDPTL